ncbi:biotin/lipoyl-containing protein [Jannaschia formosa]|uniref:biotin/lipoyl-containing protein n=1 Tax=Jannaschia formosa TaxID=2259592 RepID=UPI000E1BB5B7|nr:biotin/lipoyl-containing protein [Jannaschia formosa]TFL17196.1 pyruvate dehydrogenase [Jannaschia formosa]
MPRDVTMPQLGMAQDAGKIVSWLKAPGDAVAKGEALFEVETDKAVMEVEAAEAGFLTNVTAEAGAEVAVGAVIARISDSAEDVAEDAPATGPEPAAGPDASDDLPEGRSVTMPQLGMAQDAGRIVAWLVAPGDAVSADAALFEVETDKATMEVPAGVDGYLAATLAQAGEDVPVGQPVAIVSKTKPTRTATRSAAAPVSTPSAPPAPEQTAEAPETARAPIAPAPGGRILASPKARRLALEEGLDLADLVAAGHPQPYHVKDLEVLRALPSRTAAPATATVAAAPRSLMAEVPAEGFDAFAAWAAEAAGLDAEALLAGLAGAGLDAPATVAVERAGQSRAYAVPATRTLSGVAPTEAAPDLILRDLRGTALRTVSMGAEPVPVLTVLNSPHGLTLTLDCAAGALDAPAAIALLTTFAGRMEQPLRHLL